MYQTVILHTEDNKFSIKNNKFHNHNICQVFSRRIEQNKKANSPYNKGTIYYNMLPNDVKALSGVIFKTKLENLIVQKNTL